MTRAQAQGQFDVQTAYCLARDMLEDPRAETGLWTFVRAWLGVDALATLDKDPTWFPEFDTALRRDFRDELQAFVFNNFHSRAPIEDLFLADHVFVNRRLANLYGIEGVTSETMEKHPAPDERGGLLTQGWFLALGASETRASAPQRGTFITRRLLCSTIPNLDHSMFPEPTDDESLTDRAYQQSAENEPTCAACHNIINPLGHPFEHFDGLGQYRDLDRGQAVDASAQGIFPNNGTQFVVASSSEFLPQLWAEGDVATCMTRSWFTYALGRTIGASDTQAVDIVRSTASSLKEMLLGVAVSPLHLF